MMDIIGNIDLPKTLYKYRSWDSKYHRQVIEKRIAYFASPSSFNDPFDCKIPIRYDIKSSELLEDIYYSVIKATFPYESESQIREFSKKQVTEGTIDHKKFKKNDKKYFDNLNQRMGIFSLSSENNDILMWGHYADSHRGFCIGFETKELLTTENVDFIGKVGYFPELPLIIPIEAKKSAFSNQIFSKWDKWAYENEYRLSKFDIENRKIPLPKSCFKELIVGYAMPIREKKRIIKLVKSNFDGIEIYEAYPNEDRFFIDIKPLEL